MSMFRSFAFTVACALLPAAGQAQAQAQAQGQGLAIARVPEIVAGTRSCAAVTTALGVDQARLQADGWHRATVTNQGIAIADAGSFFSRGHLLLSVSGGSAKVCFIIARVQNTAVMAEVIRAMGQGLGVSGRSRPGEANTAYWFPPEHIVQLTMTGKSDAPAVRIAVGYTPAPKK